MRTTPMMIKKQYEKSLKLVKKLKKFIVALRMKEQQRYDYAVRQRTLRDNPVQFQERGSPRVDETPKHDMSEPNEGGAQTSPP